MSQSNSFKMKANLIVDIKYIKRHKVDEALLKKTPQLTKSVERTIKILCITKTTELRQYFHALKFNICPFSKTDFLSKNGQNIELIVA